MQIWPSQRKRTHTEELGYLEHKLLLATFADMIEEKVWIDYMVKIILWKGNVKFWSYTG